MISSLANVYNLLGDDVINKFQHILGHHKNSNLQKQVPKSLHTSTFLNPLGNIFVLGSRGAVGRALVYDTQRSAVRIQSSAIYFILLLYLYRKDKIKQKWVGIFLFKRVFLRIIRCLYFKAVRLLPKDRLVEIRVTTIYYNFLTKVHTRHESHHQDQN